MIKHVHFIGIGGTGISALARVLVEQGVMVSGSDRNASEYFKAVTELGAQTYLGHAPENVLGADIVVRSSAIPDDNVEVIAAQKAGIPVMKRSDILGSLTEGKKTIAVAGTHGKTTTSAMLVNAFTDLELNPSFILGAIIKRFDTNAKSGDGEYFIVEADEYDNMFLGLTPSMAVITNIEHDHPDCFPTPGDYLNAFKAFVDKVVPGGTVLLGSDDPGAQELFKVITRTDISLVQYGFQESHEFRAINRLLSSEGLPDFDIVHQKPLCDSVELAHCSLEVPGDHNILNALAAFAVCHLLSQDDNLVSQSLMAFQGTERRFEVAGTADGITVINDYAHHPTQIRITLQAARQRYPYSKLWVVWEPHTYSRPAALEADYIRSLSLADRIVITRIYAAREKDTGYTPLPIAQGIPDNKAKYIDITSQAINFLNLHLEPGDVVLVLSAGEGPVFSEMLLQKLQQRSK